MTSKQILIIGGVTACWFKLCFLKWLKFCSRSENFSKLICFNDSVWVKAIVPNFWSVLRKSSCQYHEFLLPIFLFFFILVVSFIAPCVFSLFLCITSCFSVWQYFSIINQFCSFTPVLSHISPTFSAISAFVSHQFLFTGIVYVLCHVLFPLMSLCACS